jgi:hypothetical protein
MDSLDVFLLVLVGHGDVASVGLEIDLQLLSEPLIFGGEGHVQVADVDFTMDIVSENVVKIEDGGTYSIFVRLL